MDDLLRPKRLTGFREHGNDEVVDPARTSSHRLPSHGLLRLTAHSLRTRSPTVRLDPFRAGKGQPPERQEVGMAARTVLVVGVLAAALLLPTQAQATQEMAGDSRVAAGSQAVIVQYGC